MSQPELSDGSIDGTSSEMEMPSGPSHKSPHETLYMLSDYKQYVKSLERPTPTHLLQPTSSGSNGGWIPVSPSTSYAESPVASTTGANVNSNSNSNIQILNNNNHNNHNGNGNNNNGPNVMDPAGESIDTETETDSSTRDQLPSISTGEESKGDEYSTDDASVNAPSDSSSNGSSLSSSSLSSSSSSHSSSSPSSSAFGDQSSNTDATSALSSSSSSENTSGKSVTGVIESANSNNPSLIDDATHSPASKPTVSYIEESDKLKPEVHFHESERISEATTPVLSTLTDSSSSYSSSSSSSLSSVSSSLSSPSSTDERQQSNRSSGFSVAAIFDREFKPIYTAKSSGEIQFGQRIAPSHSSSSSSAASRVPRSVKSQGKRQYLVPIPGGEGGIKAYVVITA